MLFKYEIIIQNLTKSHAEALRVSLLRILDKSDIFPATLLQNVIKHLRLHCCPHGRFEVLTFTHV